MVLRQSYSASDQIESVGSGQVARVDFTGVKHVIDDLAQAVRKMQVLIVDDEEDILESLHDLLDTSLDDVNILTAPNGERAVELMKENDVDLIVTDYKMPGMNGLTLLDEARTLAPGAPRILVTAFPDLEIALRAINDAKIENFFTKPLDPPKIVEVINEVLAERRQKTQRDRAFARSMSMAKKSTGKD